MPEPFTRDELQLIEIILLDELKRLITHTDVNTDDYLINLIRLKRHIRDSWLAMEKK